MRKYLLTVVVGLVVLGLLFWLGWFFQEQLTRDKRMIEKFGQVAEIKGSFYKNASSEKLPYNMYDMYFMVDNTPFYEDKNIPGTDLNFRTIRAYMVDKGKHIAKVYIVVDSGKFEDMDNFFKNDIQYSPGVVYKVVFGGEGFPGFDNPDIYSRFFSQISKQYYRDLGVCIDAGFVNGCEVPILPAIIKYAK